MKSRRTFVISMLCLVTVCGCRKQPQQEPDGYRVVSYDSTTAKWVIIRTGTFEGKRLRKRMTIICDFYQWGDHDGVSGPHACNLQVGQLIVPKHSPDAKGKYSDFVDVWEMTPERLDIQTGDGADKVDQQFVILKNELMPD